MKTYFKFGIKLMATRKIDVRIAIVLKLLEKPTITEYVRVNKRK